MSFSADYILSELKAVDRDSAIRELLQYLIFVGAIEHQFEESLFDALRQRENVLTTGVGFGVAFPHATSNAVTKKIVVLGKSKNGINFSSIDGQPTKEIYLMISPVTHEIANAA